MLKLFLMIYMPLKLTPIFSMLIPLLYVIDSPHIVQFLSIILDRENSLSYIPYLLIILWEIGKMPTLFPPTLGSTIDNRLVIHWVILSNLIYQFTCIQSDLPIWKRFV